MFFLGLLSTDWFALNILMFLILRIGNTEEVACVSSNSGIFPHLYHPFLSVALFLIECIREDDGLSMVLAGSQESPDTKLTKFKRRTEGSWFLYIGERPASQEASIGNLSCWEEANRARATQPHSEGLPYSGEGDINAKDFLMEFYSTL